MKTIKNEDGCEIFQGRPHKSGYGQLKVFGTHHYAHRYAWTQKNGPIPADRILLHTCGNKLCVNIEHLFLGVHEQMRGCGPRKLTDDQVRDIRLSAVHDAPTLARVYDVTVDTIRSVRARRTYHEVVDFPNKKA
jgi:hypothetical protein